MTVAIRHDDLLVRVGPDAMDDALARLGARQAVMGSRAMRGWVQVSGEALDDDALDAWVDQALAHAATLPAKRR